MSTRSQTENVSEEEMLREIREEIAREEAELEKNRQEMLANGTLKNDDVFRNDTGKAHQLTTFQERIVTTGSEVSIILLLLLGILFVAQAIRKAYNHLATQKQLDKVESVLNKGIPVKAEVFGLADLDPRSYPVYNTGFPEREEYYKNVEKEVPLTTLKDLLLKRAVICVERINTFQRDGQGIRKNWSMDMLPRDVWDDFNAAQVSLQEELADVMKENTEKKFQWGKYENDIWSKAREIFQEHFQRKKVELHQKMRQQGLIAPAPMVMPMGGPMEPTVNGPPYSNARLNGPTTQPPSAEEFGRGLKPGFLRDRKQRKPTKKQLLLQQQQQQQQNGGTYETTSPIDSNDNNPNQPRRRKGKRRFARK